MTARLFHRNIDRTGAEILLQKSGEDGSFLIRSSQNRLNDYVLSVRCGNQCKHRLIENNGEWSLYNSYDDKKFSTLSELLNYYMITDINDDIRLILKFPLYVDAPTAELYYHGVLSHHEANSLLENARSGNYLVRDSLSDPNNYVLCVKSEEYKILNFIIKVQKNGYILKDSHNSNNESFPTLDGLIQNWKNSCIIDTKENIIHLEQPINTSKVVAINLTKRIEILQREDDSKLVIEFAKEFDVRKLKKKELEYEVFQLKAIQLEDSKISKNFDRKEGDKPQNRCKNRHKGILPFDHTRVQLQNSSDYINANHINRFEQLNKTYIATQAPLLNTTNDFWAMIWQKSIKFILILVNEIEKESEQDKTTSKCYKYWPDLGKEVKCDLDEFSLLIKCLKIQNHEHYLVRQLTLSNSNFPNQQQTIFHFQYLVLDDFCLLENVSKCLHFIDHYNYLYKRSNCETPVVVHCIMSKTLTKKNLSIKIYSAWLDE